MAANVQSVQALEDLRVALVRLRAEADETLAAAAQEIRRTSEWLAERQQHWQTEARRCQEVARQASAVLARCQASGHYDRDGHYYPPNCTAFERALALARARLHETETELQRVQQWIGRVQAAAADYQKQAQRLSAMLGSELPNATALLGRKIDELHAYASISVPSAGGAPSISWTHSATPTHAGGASRGDVERESSPFDLPIDDLLHLGHTDSSTEHDSHESTAWVDQGMRDVPIAEVALDDSPVHSAEDFRKVSAEEMTDGLRKLDEVVRPSVAAGHDGDHFSQLDAAQGVDYEHGYRHVYDAFYGHDAIRLERAGDQYVVVNGYHRLFIARQLGWSTIPARVIAPR